jgi:hypothetical protein
MAPGLTSALRRVPNSWIPAFGDDQSVGFSFRKAQLVLVA